MKRALAAALLLLWIATATAQLLSVKLDGDQLRIAASQLHFLGSDVLQRLHNGIAATYVFKAGIASDRLNKPLNEIRYRFIISFDIFEEKFAISRTDPNPHSITHLSQAAAEAWCLDSIALPVTKLAPDQSYFAIVEFGEETPKTADSGDSLIGQLIDVFSRKSQRQESHGSWTSGPFRLSDLRKSR